jgi:hypothetical protein
MPHMISVNFSSYVSPCILPRCSCNLRQRAYNCLESIFKMEFLGESGETNRKAHFRSDQSVAETRHTNGSALVADAAWAETQNSGTGKLARASLPTRARFDRPFAGHQRYGCFFSHIHSRGILAPALPGKYLAGTGSGRKCGLLFCLFSELLSGCTRDIGRA